MIKILILSPTPALRAGLRALLASDPDLVVTAVAASAMESAFLKDSTDPVESADPTGSVDVVIATQGGIDLASRGVRPDQALLLVTGDAQEAQALADLELRAWGVISPETTAEALQAAVRALAEGLVVATPEILRQALQESTAAPTPGRGMAGRENGVSGEEDEPVDPLTGRENDVLLRMAQGLTNKQIALALGISEHTVKFHVSSIYSKLGVSNRTEAVRKGARKGWIPL